MNTLRKRIRGIGVGSVGECSDRSESERRRKILEGGSWEIWRRQGNMAVSLAMKIEAMLRVQCDFIVPPME